MMASLRSLLSARKHTRDRAPHLELGAKGEKAAARYLESVENYRIVATNFLVPLGRGLYGRKLSGEIDIVAYDESTLVFVEVKARTSDDLISPTHAVDLRKRRQIVRAARRYRRLMKVWLEPYRYDVITIVFDKDRDRIELLRGYFDDSVFQRKKFFPDH
jgi:putative endonuclease